jgi:hypothetical protein
MLSKLESTLAETIFTHKSILGWFSIPREMSKDSKATVMI